MKKCDYCGREGTAPDVRGVGSVAVQLGNYRLADYGAEITICETCADAVMRKALGGLLDALGVKEDSR